MGQNKRTSEMCQKKHNDSVKLRQETKNFIDEMVVNGLKVSKKAVRDGMHVSNGFVNNPEITAYIKQAQALQKKEELNVDVDYQDITLFRKLMASYVFQYSLLDEEETFLKQAIEDMKQQIEHKKEQ